MALQINFFYRQRAPCANTRLPLLSDIYVSTNSDGNLTNANLEAISANACMIVPAPQHEKNIDVKTTEYLADAVSYFRHDDPNDLKDKILHLINNPQEIKRLSRKLATKKKSLCVLGTNVCKKKSNFRYNTVSRGLINVWHFWSYWA